MTFHAPGIVTVGAVIAGKPGFATVNVVNTKVAKIEIEPLAHPVVVGSSEKLVAIPRTPGGDPRSDVTIKWTSEKTSIASVDAAGLVTGHAPGSVTIKATADDASATATLQVGRDNVRKLSVSPATADARTGDVVHFTAAASDAEIGRAHV